MIRFATARFVASVLALLVVSAATSTRAADTEYWLERPSQLAQGESESIAISRQGELFLAPATSQMSRAALPGQPSFSLALVETANGTVYLGTGPDGKILRFGSSGKGEIFATLDAPLVTAMVLLPDGTLLASASPSGVLVQISGDGKQKRWAETEHGYLWALTLEPDGSVVAAAGEPAALIRVKPNGRVETLATFSENHARSLLSLGSEGWIVGGSGNGRVYQVDREGHVLVLHDDDLPEISALARTRDGSIYATVVESPAEERARPAVTIRLPDSQQQLNTDAFGVMDDDDNSVLRGVIEGLPVEDQGRSTRVRGKLMRIDPEGSVQQIWRSSGAAPLGLTLDREGQMLFGTGEPARLYRVESDQVSLIRTFPASQISAMGPGARPVIATSSPVTLHRLEPQTEESGSFVSRVYDSATLTRWGTIRWTEFTGSGRVEFYTRTGNSSTPDETWSGWSPALSNANGSPIINPEGRFAQWRMRLVGGGSNGVRVRDIQVSHRPINRAPRMRELRFEGDIVAVNESATLRWSAMDPDKDPIEVLFEIRPAQSQGEWRPIGPDTSSGSLFDSSRRTGWREDQRVWRTADMDPGRYELRARVSDRRANPPDEGLDWSYPLRLTIAIDHASPEVEIVTESANQIELLVTDADSQIHGVSFLVDGRTAFTAQPVDGVVDANQERFVIDLPEQLPRESKWSIRASDRAGNAIERILRESSREPRSDEPPSDAEAKTASQGGAL